MKSLSIDGSQGEGGGQILRTSLSLSMLTGRPIQLHNIRAGRAKPGLMRQHLVCVDAARALCNGFAEGATLGATTLTFTPNDLQSGAYRFDIGSAGSTMLVLQTVLPAMLQMSAPCSVQLIGGTHNPMAPTADFFDDCFLPQLHAMGANVQFELGAVGLFPAGRGSVKLATTPTASLVPVSLLSRVGTGVLSAHSIAAGVPAHVADRELAWLQETAQSQKGKEGFALGRLKPTHVNHTGPGNVLGVSLRFDNVCEHATAIGSKGISAEEIAKLAFQQISQFLSSGAVVGEHLADQLLLPMVLAQGGEFLTGEPSEHLRTNAQVIEAFGITKISITPEPKSAANANALWRVGVQC